MHTLFDCSIMYFGKGVVYLSHIKINIVEMYNKAGIK
nr:MAG TPA: hypothetical protein [Caudoviricetes sp.]